MKPNQPLSLADHRLLDLVWQAAPIPSPELCKLAQEKLGWKRTTTYTVIKRLGERGVLKNQDGLVTALISREDAQVSELDELMEKKFQGSLPAFLSAFARRQSLTEKEVEEIRRIIEK